MSFSEMIDPGELDKTFASAKEIGEVQHVYRSEVGSGTEASRLVLQTEVGKGREALYIQSKPSYELVEEGLTNIGASEVIKLLAMLFLQSSGTDWNSSCRNPF